MHFKKWQHLAVRFGFNHTYKKEEELYLWQIEMRSAYINLKSIPGVKIDKINKDIHKNANCQDNIGHWWSVAYASL